VFEGADSVMGFRFYLDILFLSKMEGSRRFLNGGVCVDPNCMNCNVHTPSFAVTGTGRLPLPRRMPPRPAVVEEVAPFDVSLFAETTSMHKASPSFVVNAPEGVAEDTFFEDDFVRRSVELAQRERVQEKVILVKESLSLMRAQSAEAELRRKLALEKQDHLQEQQQYPHGIGVSFVDNENVVGGGGWRAGSENRVLVAKEREVQIQSETLHALEAIKRMAERSANAREEVRRKELEALRKLEQLKKDKEDAIANQKSALEKQKQQQHQAVQQAEQRVAQQTMAAENASLNVETESARLLASYQALADAFPKDKVGVVFFVVSFQDCLKKIFFLKKKTKKQIAQLFKMKAPVTKALNQVTSDPQVTISRAKDIVAVLGQAAQLSPDIAKIVQLHFATQICAMVTSKMGTKPANVFPFAAVTAYVCHKFGECWPILTAKLQSNCQYLIPKFESRRGANDSESAVKQRLGCNNEANYIREQNGFVTFYCAVCCAQVSPTGDWRFIMPRMPELWKLLASILNQKPGFMAPDVLTAIFEVAGAELLLVYGKQAQKLLRFAHSVYLPMCRNPGSTCDGIVDRSLVLRLTTLLETSAKANYTRIPEVDAKVPKKKKPQTKKFFSKCVFCVDFPRVRADEACFSNETFQINKIKH
jgi:hypothetical protein